MSYRNPKPWLHVIDQDKVVPRRCGHATVICEMCDWMHKPRTRKGIRKAVLLHRHCGFAEA